MDLKLHFMMKTLNEVVSLSPQALQLHATPCGLTQCASAGPVLLQSLAMSFIACSMASTAH